VIDLSTGSRRVDVTASVGKLFVSNSGRFVAVSDYDRQHAVSVHCLDGLWRQIVEEDVARSVVYYRCIFCLLMLCLHDRANIEQVGRRSNVINMLIRKAGGL